MKTFTAADGEIVRESGTAMQKKPNPVYMLRVEGSFTVQTNEGPLQCPDGYVAFDPISGHVWPVAQEYVELHYEKVGVCRCDAGPPHESRRHVWEEYEYDQPACRVKSQRVVGLEPA